MKNDILISANALNQFIRENGVVYSNKLDKFAIKDAERVVRCKDCICYQKGNVYLPHCTNLTGGMASYAKENDFCSRGIKKQ